MCVLSACVFSAGAWSLLKLSQPGSYWKPGRCRQAGRRWKRCRRRSGAGGYSFPRITAVSGALYFCENNGISAGQRRYSDFRITVSVDNGNS